MEETSEIDHRKTCDGELVETGRERLQGTLSVQTLGSDRSPSHHYNERVTFRCLKCGATNLSRGDPGGPVAKPLSSTDP